MISQEAIRELGSIVGEVHILCHQRALEYGKDGTRLSYKPDLVVLPGTPEEIREILRLANIYGFPVIPRGAGTGMSGGALPVKGGVILSMERFTRIIELSPEDGVALVEVGVTTERLQREAESVGLYYPPDPASARECTIGGNIAECAGGLRAIKYGVTRDYVLGLEIVIPKGEIMYTGARTLKGVVGYDLTRLLIGSEGTLAVITKAWLRLIPRPESKATAVAVFPGVGQAMDCLFKILSSGILPSGAEFVDRVSFECARELWPYDLERDIGAILILELDGRYEQVKQDLLGLEWIISHFSGDLLLSTMDQDLAKEAWEFRRALSQSMYRLRPNKTSEDVVVPRSRLKDIMRFIEELSAETRLPIPVFGHAGDGNLHVNILYDESLEEEREKVPRVIRRLFEKVLDLGGTISGEHGIGITKAGYLGMELDNHQIQLMKDIKRVFDPNNILNPHKIFA